MLKTRSTSTLTDEGVHKLLLYAHHGFGKTYQCRNYQARYGKGLIISGESGLRSVEDVDIEFVEFKSWDGPVDESKGIYSFRSIIRALSEPGYMEGQGYNWIAIDSLTELSDRLLEHLEKEHAGSKNGFAMWADYNRLMVGALKWVRDLPVHVYITALAKEEKDANDVTQFWPMVKGASVGKQVPALFDHVFCGVRTAEKSKTGLPKVTRYVITEEVNGWHGKARDPRRSLKSFEECNDVTELLERMGHDVTAAPEEPK